ncbi:ribose-5-phosphate isomerase RpiA [Candidatus Woesearchaeota archaeon]|jgi:ribose 5-phosphate isomerase A|nr:ribose-5-phosphate isomerase RpiA [Candidatus Woesearchaeota archaeon]
MNDKQRAAEYAAGLITSGLLVGLGTGSTANYFIEALARRQREEQLTIQTVSSSPVSAVKARALNLSVLAIEQVDKLDIYVDGADEVTPDKTLLKGRGADLVREKLLASNSAEFWVLIDSGKLVNHIGEKFPVPVEVLPFAWQLVKRQIEAAGGRCELRLNATQDGLAVTSQGNLVLDARFDDSDACTLNEKLNAMAGIVEHGIFHRLATRIFCGNAGQTGAFHEKTALGYP